MSITETVIYHAPERGFVSHADRKLIKFFNPLSIFLHLKQYALLIRQMTWREVLNRYKGTALGLFWSFLQPLIMLSVYTFVFSVIFQARWGAGMNNGKLVFALILFIGIITYNIFAESVNASSTLILQHANLVKKVVFPLEILPLVIVLSTLIQALFSLLVLMIGIILILKAVSWTFILLPVIWLPLILLTLGASYFIASLGVFLRDIGSTVGILTSILFFLTPIFYPIDIVPDKYLILIKINPLATFVENARLITIAGQMPDWDYYFSGLVVSILVLGIGFVWFMKSKNAFADVI